MAIIKTIKVGSTTYDINDSRIADLPLSISQGGTGATTKALAQAALDIDEMLNLGLDASTGIPSGTDLNTITTVGSYHTTASSTTVLNSPAGADAHGYSGGFRLYVSKANSNYIKQILWPASGSDFWIRSSTNGGSSWSTWVNLNNDTDTKVSQNTLSTDATFPLIVKGTSATVSVTGTVGFTTAIYSNPNKSNLKVQGPASSSSASGAAFRVIPANGNTTVATLMNYEEGTASSVGTGAVVLGNAVASGAVGNAKGMIILYGENKQSSRITSAAASSSKNQTLPNKEGWIPVGGNGSSSGEGSSSTPIYMAADGELKPVTSIDSSLYEDQYVKQTETNGNYYYPILTTATQYGNVSGTITGSAKYSDVRIAHGKGTVITEGVAGSMVGNSSAGFKVHNATTMVAGMWHAVEGTASAVGYGSAVVGNSTASGTAGNAAGRIYVYGTSTGRNLIVSDVTNGDSPTNYLPNVTGYLAVGSTAGVGGGYTPVYMDDNGELKAVTKSLNSYVTLDTAQTISGKKTFSHTDGIAVNKIATASGNTIYVNDIASFTSTVYFANGKTYYVGSSGNGSFANVRLGSSTAAGNITGIGNTLIIGTTLTINKPLILKSGTTITGNYTTSVPSATNGVPTGQVMFVIQ